jgi:hypothetical protein
MYGGDPRSYGNPRARTSMAEPPAHYAAGSYAHQMIVNRAELDLPKAEELTLSMTLRTADPITRCLPWRSRPPESFRS